MRALIVADTESKYIWDHFDKQAIGKVDVILSCGDLKASYLSFLTTMVAAPLYYVCGNHDGSYIKNPPEGCDRLDNKIVNVKGVRIMGFSGCKSRSPKPFHYSEKDVHRQVVKRIPQLCLRGGFDVLVTHAPAFELGDGKDTFHQGFKSYRTLIDMFKPSFHFHGHQHMNYGAAKREIQYGNTRIINGYGYHIINIDVPDKKHSRLSYLMTRYQWEKNNAASF
ncbi:MAG TPA: metallophosphoesterase [Clostridiales bacterium]|nr:metallophosphoesterase [Clostridiales bacterium]